VERNLEHLILPQWKEPLSRRKRPGGKGVERNIREHGQKLITQARLVSQKLQQRTRTYPKGINPKLVFKLKLHPKGRLDEETLSKLGLFVLARDPEKAIVVFPTSAALEELLQKIQEYAGIVPGSKYEFLSAIEEILELSADDRKGRRLSCGPLQGDEIANFDIELWHTGNRQDCVEKIAEIKEFLKNKRLRVFDDYIGDSLCLIRAELNQHALDTLLQIDFVKEIDRRPAPCFEILDITSATHDSCNLDNSHIDNAIGVLVIDSGVMQGHPLIGPALGDAQIFPDRLKTKVRGGADDGDNATGGHGTAVAGIAIYGDVGASIKSRLFTPTARLFSGRVTDDNNEYDPEELLEHQLKECLDYFLTNYESVKVINISLGDDRLELRGSSYQFRLAAAIDEYAFEHRDREILFVISAGNGLPKIGTGDQLAKAYPEYLSGEDSLRIIDPATAALAVTVGGISYGQGQAATSAAGVVVAEERGWPSPFTRTGPGIDGAIKPDLVDFAGALRVEHGKLIDPRHPAYAGLPSTNKGFSPPTGALFRTVAGTSFAAPRVANLAAQAFFNMPDASSNLVRALLASSAKVPGSRPKTLAKKKPCDEDIWRIYGYGVPNLQDALWSAKNDCLLLAEGEIEVDAFQIFEIPGLPDEFLGKSGKRTLAVALAFDPPTRHTRADSYLGITMEFALFRNVEPEMLSESLRAWNREEKEDLEDAGEELPGLASLKKSGTGPTVVDLLPKVTRRKKGTLQKGICEISRSNWSYDGKPLYVVVVCQRKWAPVEITHQRFAVVASLSHESPDVDLHAHMRQYTRVYQRARVRV
jgi:subtilisin family serine protease